MRGAFVAVGEAIDFARQHSALAIGLHVSLNDIKPVLSPHQVSMLVQSDGRFPPDHSLLHAALWSAKGREQVRAEIAAQFSQFHAIGCAWDHVNSHRHVHLNPFLARIIWSEAAYYKVRATRIPWDPPTDLARTLRAIVLRRLAASYGINAPDRSISRLWTGPKLANYLKVIPTGLTELYFHPVDSSDHMYANDLPLLLDTNVKASLAGLMVSGLQGAK